MNDIAIIGLRAFPSDYEGIGGIETRGETFIKLIEPIAKVKKVRVYVLIRKWLKEISVQQDKSNGVVRIVGIPSFSSKYFDTFIYSFLSSIFVCCVPSIKTVMYEGVGSVFFSILPKIFGKKIIITVHSLEWKRRKWNVLGKQMLIINEFITAHIANRIICVSQVIKNYFDSKYHVKSALIQYFLKFEDKERSNAVEMNTYKLKNNGYALFLGRFVPEKRIEWIIKAFQLLKKGNAKLVIAGESSFSNDPYSRSLRNLAVNNKNIIFTGYVFGENKKQLLKHARFLVLPSEIEGSPISVFEALSMRKPVLVSKLPEFEELLCNNAFMFRPNNFRDFVEKFNDFYSEEYIIKKKDINLINFPSREDFIKKYVNEIFQS